MVQSRQQRWAADAYNRVLARSQDPKCKEYRSVSRWFPTLVHNSGLCQALAFAKARASDKRAVLSDYVEDLREVLGIPDLEARSRCASTAEYQRITREALLAASWIKRYAEALIEGESADGGQG